MNTAVPRYERIASDYARQIDAGRLAAGERMPSVRDLARQRRVSATTAVAALRALEQRGLIEARPQSGFYVSRPSQHVPEPRTSRPPATARAVDIGQLLAMASAGRDDPDIIPLGAAMPEPAWFPARSLQRRIAAAARAHPELIDRYGPVAGLPALRQQLVRRYARFGCALELDELLITNGAMEALNVALRTVAEPGATIAVESPCYFGILQTIESYGMKALEIATHPHTGLSVDALAAALAAPAGRALRACIVVSSYSNPLGATLPDEQKQRLLALCVQHDIALIEDDIYGELAFNGPRPPPIKTWDTQGQVLLVSSTSKTLAPGARIGWLAAGRWAEAARLRKYMASVATAELMQYTLADFIGSGGYERHLRRLRLQCARQVAKFSAAIERAFPEGTRLSRPDGGFVLWVEMPRRVDAVTLQAQARAAGVHVLPGALFSASGQYRHCLRINCGRDFTPRVAAAVKVLGDIAGRLAANENGSA